MNIFSTKGRIGRLAFLLWMIPLWCLTAVLISSYQDFGCSTILAYASLTILMLNIFPVVRRLHDINVAGWYWFVIFVPLMNFLMLLYLLFEKGSKDANKYGGPPAPPRNFYFFSITPPEDDAQFYKKAYEELEDGKADKSLWAKTFAQSDGDENKAKALYIKSRVKTLKATEVP